MLTTKQVEAIANDVLGVVLKDAGFQRAAVTAGDDDTGERALFVKARIDKGFEALPGPVASDAISFLRDSLLTAGEERFPYLDFEFPGDAKDRDGPPTQ